MPNNTRPSTVKSSAKLAPNLGPQHTESMGSYVVKPNGVHFATQAETEQILLILRRHPITQLLWILFAAVLILFPPLILPFLQDVFADLQIPGSYQVVITLFWYLATFAFILTNFVLWYFNVNIVTDQRVLDIDFPSLLIQDVSGTHIEQIEDVTFQQIGVFSSIFNYGNVFVQTAGPTSNIEFLQVPNPKNVSRIILDLMGLD
jgi:hypothetical protein